MVKSRITEAEVRAAASSIAALDYLSTVAEYDGPGSLVMQNGHYAGVSTIPLNRSDFGAVIGFLMERHQALLAGLDVEMPNEQTEPN